MSLRIRLCKSPAARKSDLNWPLGLPEHLCTVSHLTKQSDWSYQRGACHGQEASWRWRSWPALKDVRPSRVGKQETKHSAMYKAVSDSWAGSLFWSRWRSPFWPCPTLPRESRPSWESALENTKVIFVWVMWGIHYWVILEFWLVIVVPIY